MATKLLTDRQRKAIAAAIHDHHLAFTAEMLGPSAISDEDYKRLKAAGKIRSSAPLVTDAATAAHILGSMTSGMAAGDDEKLSANSFWRIVKEQTPDLTAMERDAVTITRDRVAEHVKGLANKVDAATGQIVVDANAELHKKKLLREAVASGIASRESARKVAQRMRDATKDVRRDWVKIAATEMHNATEEAKAVALIEGAKKGDDPFVYKRCRPDACPFCKLLYMNGKVPRVFRLSELQANGTNVGRKAGRARLKGPHATEYKATLGAMHPWCQCSLHHMPAGMAFNTSGQLVYVGTRKSTVMIESLDQALLNHECE